MSLIAIPNISEGRDPAKVSLLAAAAASSGASVADVHSDLSHNRSVLTVCGEVSRLVEAMTALAAACGSSIDLTSHTGLHPRLGALDVCPFVYLEDPGPAVEAARATALRIGSELGLPVLLYGEAARRDEWRELPALRRGGLERWAKEFAAGTVPDAGPSVVDPSRGVVCVGARRPLIAFNVWLRTELSVARKIAAEVRASGGELPGVRALALELEEGWSQVSMNLTEPGSAGIDEAFDYVAKAARSVGIREIRGEIVGLPLDRYMPDPAREAARQISPPGRSLESVLRIL